jgi:hypothetical protein
MSGPPTQVHSFSDGLNFQRSLRMQTMPPPQSSPVIPAPDPPKSQRLPDASVHAAAPKRAPGALPGAGVPRVP